MTDDTASASAHWLLQQHRDRAPFKSLAHLTDIVGAYDVQERFVTLLAQAGQGSIAGYKIGLTGRRMQKMCGIGHPIAGVVLSTRVHHSPATVARRDFVHLGVESELAVQLARPVQGAVTPAELLGSIAGVAAAFELIDDRGADYAALEAKSLVADNSWNEGIVLGRSLALRELGQLEGALEVNGEIVDRGSSSSVLGGPLAALAWLATHLAARGSRIEAGAWVMTGSIVPTRFAEPGQHYRFSLGPLAPVELTVS